MPGNPGGPAVTTLVCFFICTRGCGCIGRPAFPTPSFFFGRRIYAKLGRIAPRECRCMSHEYERAKLSVVIPAKAGIQYSRGGGDKSRGRGVLDRPVKPDDDRSWWRSESDEAIR